MKEQLVELLKYLKDAIEFGKGQAPLVAQEILRYAKIVDWTSLCVGLALVAAGFLLIFYFAKKMQIKGAEGEDGMMEDYYIAWKTADYVAGVLSLFIGVSIAMWYVFDLIEIYSAPRLFILEYVKGLM